MLKTHKRAFTLSEVLLTISVIGIVAALILPAVQRYSFEMEAVAKAKATYSMLSDAVKRWQMDSDCINETYRCPEISPTVWPGGAHPHNEEAIARAMKPYLQVVKEVYSPSDATAKTLDFLPEKSWNLNGTQTSSSVYTGFVMDRNQSQYGFSSFFLLNNGVVVEIVGSWWGYDIIFDINGPKNPNRRGKDQFIMSLASAKQRTSNPYLYNSYNNTSAATNGECNNSATAPSNCNPDDGKSPLAYVLKHSKLPDFKKMGYPTTP